MWNVRNIHVIMGRSIEITKAKVTDLVSTNDRKLMKKTDMLYMIIFLG